MPALSVQVSTNEAPAIRRSTRLTQKTVSDAALPPVRPKAKDYQIRIDPTTRIPVTIPPSTIPPVTRAQVRSQLADFP